MSKLNFRFLSISILFCLALLQLPLIANAAFQSSISLTSISSRIIKPGESVTWNFDIRVANGSSFSVGGYIEDPSGKSHSVTFDSAQSKGGISSEIIHSSGTLYTHSEIQPGKFRLTSIWLSTPGAITEIRDPNSTASNLSGSSGYTSTTIDLSAYSFEISDTGKYQPYSPQLIQKFSIDKLVSNTSDQYEVTAELLGESYLSFFLLQWRDANGNLYSSYCDMYPNNGPEHACKVTASVQGKSYVIKIPIIIPKDAPGGINTIGTIDVTSRTGLTGVSGNSSSYTWGSSARYDKLTNTLNSDGKILPTQLDFSKLTFTNIATSAIPSRPPTWSKVSWANSTVAAGNSATLLISIDASQRKIAQISLYSLVGSPSSGNQTLQLYRVPEIKRLDDPSAIGLFPATSSGDFAIDVWIPRSAKPGTYTIGQLTVISTICNFLNQNELNSVNKDNGEDCLGPTNVWNTTSNYGILSGTSWTEYSSLSSLTIVITSPGPVDPPRLVPFKIDSTSVEFKLDQTNKGEYQNCIPISSLGLSSLTYGTSEYSMNVLVNGLQPDSDVKFELSCTTSDGLPSKSGEILAHTSKPAPPLVPTLTYRDVTASVLKLRFDADANLIYNAQSSSGLVSIINGALTISDYDPKAKIAVTLSATDSYLQTSIGNTEYYLPSGPVSPVLSLIKQDSKGIYLLYSPKQGLSYKISSSAGKATDVAGRVMITGLKKGVRLLVQLTAIDSFQQVAKSKSVPLVFKGGK